MFIRIWPSEKLLYLPFEVAQVTSKFCKVQIMHSEKLEKMALSTKSLAGPGYIILNAIRVMNIIGFLAIITASIVMLVKTSSSSSFFFFDAVTHVLTAITGMFLATSEMSLFRRYFARNWPLLGPDHGFVTLALAMIVLGVNMLGNLNKTPTSQENLGLAFWRIVIASGIVIFILGFVNLIASYVFRDYKQGITARQVRAKGAVAVHKSPMPECDSPSAPVLAQSYISNPITPSPTKQGGGFRIFATERRQSTLPSYHASQLSPPMNQPVSPTSRYSRMTTCTKKKVFGIVGKRQSIGPPLPVHVHEPQISAPAGVNPQFAHLVTPRPNSSLHPSRTGGSGTTQDSEESKAFHWRF